MKRPHINADPYTHPDDYADKLDNYCDYLETIIKIKMPEPDDDKYYPFSIPQNVENFIDDIMTYCSYLKAKIVVERLERLERLDRHKFYCSEDD